MEALVRNSGHIHVHTKWMQRDHRQPIWLVITALAIYQTNSRTAIGTPRDNSRREPNRQVPQRYIDKINTGEHHSQRQSHSALSLYISYQT